MIDTYHFGQMKVDGQIHRQDLKIIQDQVITPWWRNRGHQLCLEDIEDILATEPGIIIVGTGAYGRMRVSPEIAEELEPHNIILIAEPTAEATTLFNRYLSSNHDIAGAFHLSC